MGFPASDPNVTAVGGTQIYQPTPVITSYSAEEVWNDGFGAGGGGYSVVFTRPSYQDGVVSNAMRGLPDIAYNAAVISAVLVYESFDPTVSPGWALIGGTSAATPQWAALAALADNYAANNSKGPIGFLNPKLYVIGSQPGPSTLPTSTTSQWAITASTGSPALAPLAGWDAASGWGTPDAAHLIPDLVGP